MRSRPVRRAGDLNLNAWMVERGRTLAYRRYSRACVDYEAGARSARRGRWRGEFMAPKAPASSVSLRW